MIGKGHLRLWLWWAKNMLDCLIQNTVHWLNKLNHTQISLSGNWTNITCDASWMVLFQNIVRWPCPTIKDLCATQSCFYMYEDCLKFSLYFFLKNIMHPFNFLFSPLGLSSLLISVVVAFNDMVYIFLLWNTFKILLWHRCISINWQFTSAMENNCAGKRLCSLSYPGARVRLKNPFQLN
jgi:hypothetical protein